MPEVFRDGVPGITAVVRYAFPRVTDADVPGAPAGVVPQSRARMYDTSSASTPRLRETANGEGDFPIVTVGIQLSVRPRLITLVRNAVGTDDF